VSGLATALGFLTRIPAARGEALATGALASAVVWFPVVGALVGLVLGGTRILAELALPAGAATVLALAAAVLITGGLHEDGLADTADGFGAHASRERRLEIMRDPRVGTYGTLAVVLVTLLAWTTLSGLDGEACLRTAVAAHVVARWSMLVHGAASPRARPDGAGALLAVGPGTLSAATIATAALAVIAAGPAAAGAAGGVALAVAAAMTVAARRAIGGSSGDTHGAVEKLAEVAAYAAVAAVL